MTAATELLSIFSLIELKWLITVWASICIISVLICLGLLYKIKPVFRFKAEKLQPSELLLLCILGFSVISLGIIALMTPPTNWDSMSYHMSRVAHWIQNHDINHYPTNIERQLIRTPWSEFAIMHLQVLSGGDRFAHLIQWFSMLGSIIGVSLIARQMGAKRLTQIFAAVVAATIPMGILQASSTGNDYVVCFWSVCFVYYLILIKQKPRAVYYLAAGTSLGLAALTKLTAFIYAFPFLTWYGISEFRNLRNRIWKPILVIIFAVMLINLGHAVRNMDIYGNPLPQGRNEANKIFTAPVLVSNIIRHTSLHTAVPSERINALNEKGINLIHSFLGIDDSDPRTTHPASPDFYIAFSLHEDSTGNFLHLILIIVCVIVFFRRKQKKSEQDIRNYCLVLIGGYLLFCFLLNWTPWRSRLHLTLFVLWAPFIAIVLSGAANPYRNRDILILVSLVLFLASLPWVLSNHCRRVIGKQNIFTTRRIDKYFVNRPDIKIPYMEITDYIRTNGYSDIGLSLGENDWEYPLWVLLKNCDRPVRIEHVDVKNPSGIKSCAPRLKDFDPDAVISIRTSEEDETIVKEIISGKEWVSEY